MKKIITVLFVLLFITSVVFAQDKDIRQELADTKVALLAQRQATIQAKANWLDREKILLEREVVALRMSIESVRIELAELFECSDGYDLDKRSCSPDLKTEEGEEK